ncbi:MAG: TonB-dependent receptor, partial [Bacteroidetes bacterium]
PSPQRFTLSGFVEDAETGERIPGASVFSITGQIGSLSNEYGFFSLTLPAGAHRIGVSYLGYERMEQPIQLATDEHLNFELQPAFLQEIVVTTQPDSVLVESPSLSVEHISLENARKLPSLGGEADVVRLTYQLAGIQTASDGLGGLSVRGGNVDQNLFLLDGVPVYNPLHGVGISSVYNASAIRSAQLYKGVMPAKFGGRTSAVLDVQTKEGNSKALRLETDLGLTSGKVTVEGPLVKEKSSFFVSGRRAFYDFFVVPYTTRKRREDFIDGFVSYFFYDLNLKVNHRFSERDRLYLSYYRGADDFLDVNEQEVRNLDTLVFFADNSQVFWGNVIASLRWNHTFSPRLFANTTLTYSKYAYRSQDFLNLTQTIDTLPPQVLDALVLGYNSNNKDLAANLDFDWFPHPGHRVEFGVAAVRHRFQPGVISLDIPTDIDFDTILNRQPLKSYE